MKQVLRMAALAAGCELCLCSAAWAAGPPATVPFRLDHNRVVVDVTVQGAGGEPRAVRAWLDMWGSEVLMTGTLARELGLQVPAGTGRTAEVSLPSPLRLGGVALDGSRVRTRVSTGSRWLVPGLAVDLKLPLTSLHAHQVVIDFPARRLTLASPGAIAHRGSRLPVAINPKNGMIQVETQIDGQPHSFVLDGAPCSAVSDALIAELAAAHAGWPRWTGALGAANVWGMAGEASWPMVRVASLAVGPLAVTNLALVGPPGFIGYYSSQALRPVSGLLGGNFLAAFRIDFDFAGTAIYLEPGRLDRGGDLDLVGLTVRPQADGRYTVLALASRDGQPAVEGIEPGDVLVLIDGVDPTGAGMGEVVDRLRGAPGDARVLVLERNGRRVVVSARVQRWM